MEKKFAEYLAARIAKETRQHVYIGDIENFIRSFLYENNLALVQDNYTLEEAIHKLHRLGEEIRKSQAAKEE